jgi:hypothetical protein
MIARTYQALGLRFGLRSEDTRFAKVVDELYAACSTPIEPDIWYHVTHDSRANSDRVLFVNGERVAGIGDPSWLLGYLMWHVNHQVIERSTGPYVLLHAAAAVVEGTAIVLPGAPEAGKTTLVAGLVQAGAGYLTDEAAAIDPSTLDLIPYPKPLSLDRGSWELLPDLAPSGDLALHCREQWRIPPTAIRPEAVASSTRSELIVFPHYAPGSDTVLEPLTRSQALLDLLHSNFGFQEDPRRNLAVLAHLLADTPAFRLRTGGLPEACGAVTTLAAQHSTGRAALPIGAEA